MIELTIFNNEENVLINGICKNERLSTFTRENAVQALLFSRQIANEDDTMITDLIDGTVAKLQAMKDAEWDELKMYVPLPVAVTAEEEVSEVPADADE